MKNPFLNAVYAFGYIVLIVSVVSLIADRGPDENILVPMTMLGLFVLSVAVMAFLFFSQPLQIYHEGRKQEALAYFGKTVATFAGLIALFAVVVFILL